MAYLQGKTKVEYVIVYGIASHKLKTKLIKKQQSELDKAQDIINEKFESNCRTTKSILEKNINFKARIKNLEANCKTL